MTDNFDIIIIGGGILGTSISYFLSHLNKSKKIAVLEQESRVAVHTSGRNTGKVHAPYLYNPEKKNFLQKLHSMVLKCWKNIPKLKICHLKRWSY